MVNIKKWEVSHLDKDRAAQLAERYAIPFFLAMMIEIRGFAKHMDEILETEIALSDPFLMKDMDRAVERIRNAIDSFERIAVYGDYDADGVTSTSMLYTYLEARGADVMYYIPQREGEGYGMNPAAVRSLYEAGVKLIITVDNGISAVEEAACAKELGLDLIVTDHHLPGDTLPDAIAVVDPKRPDDESPFKDLCGAGVAFKLCAALDGCPPEEMLEYCGDLAAVGTVADVMPLTGENRTIVREGLSLLQDLSLIHI